MSESLPAHDSRRFRSANRKTRQRRRRIRQSSRKIQPSWRKTPRRPRELLLFAWLGLAIALRSISYMAVPVEGKNIQRTTYSLLSINQPEFSFMTTKTLTRSTPRMRDYMVPAALTLAIAGAAYAGADTTFDPALTMFTDFLEGSGGKIITVLSLAGGLIGLASGRFSLGQVAVPVGVGIGVGTGVPIVTSVVTAVI